MRLEYDKLLSTFAFNFHLRRYSVAAAPLYTNLALCMARRGAWAAAAEACTECLDLNPGEARCALSPHTSLTAHSAPAHIRPLSPD